MNEKSLRNGGNIRKLLKKHERLRKNEARNLHIRSEIFIPFEKLQMSRLNYNGKLAFQPDNLVNC